MTAVEKYILQFEPEVQEKLNALRQLVFDVFLTTEDFLNYMNDTYPKALSKLKEICEL